MPPKDTANDLKLDIAVSTNGRHTKTWKNEQWTWGKLLERLAAPQVTHETYAEYLKMPKMRQDEIKDVGGFVGGYLQGGRRKPGSVVHRQLVCLDEDQGAPDTWGDVTLLYDFTLAMYTTHKHCPEAPRRRFVIPLDRPVDAAEYAAIARRLAADEFGDIDLFDHTTFQPERLMYWPSVARDGVFAFQQQPGPLVSADAVLGRYLDWRDTSAWPISTRERGFVQRDIRKQGDPLEKPGVVGAFCRCFTIPAAIETFLSDRYTPTDHEDRYSFAEGSTAGGLVVCEDKFAYSHHATDPAGQQLCNAFDLVRLHRYGLRDEDVKPGTPVNKLPSYVAMLDFATKEPTVKRRIVEEKLEQARGDFELITPDVIENPEPENEDWKERLDSDRKGNLYNTIDNLVLILENDPALRGAIAYDEFEQRPFARRNLPWRRVAFPTRYLIDRDDDNLEHYIEARYGIAPTRLQKALSVIYEKNQVHPIREYLDGLSWDGEARIENLFIEYMGAEASDYVRAVSRKTLAAAVARVFQPGIKFDYVLTLVGEQGKKKSTLLAKLGRNWFTDTFHLSMLQNKDGYEQLRGAWIVEIGEMAGMAKTEVERIKNFVSAREDRYRPAYGRRVETFARQCIFFGTTNKSDFLRDVTGNRRFWPVQIVAGAAIRDVAEISNEEIDQLWAEAVTLYRKGEALYLTGEEETGAIAAQKSHTVEHPWAGQVVAYLDKKLPADWPKMSKYQRREYLRGDELQPEGVNLRERVCVAEIWEEALGKNDAIDERNAEAIKGILRGLEDWKEVAEPLRFGPFGLQRRGFVRADRFENGRYKRPYTRETVVTDAEDLL